MKDSRALIDVLRSELTAVNQQFVHVLALRTWGDTATAARIMEVDAVDFPAAMRIIDHLVDTGQEIDLRSEDVVPGDNRQAILAAEQRHEQRLAAILHAAASKDPRVQAIVRDALAPREDYAAWLAGELAEAPAPNSPSDRPFAETLSVFAELIAQIEQAMVHAFVHRHAGDAEGADAAWAASGGAMMFATRFVRLFAAHDTTPVAIGVPPLTLAIEPAQAVDFDREAAARCARKAAEAAQACADPKLADLCRAIADDNLEAASWSPGAPHPAARTNPPAFASFKATLNRFVRE
jgi:bacterioferritin (cytochrome b1)